MTDPQHQFFSNPQNASFPQLTAMPLMTTARSNNMAAQYPIHQDQSSIASTSFAPNLDNDMLCFIRNLTPQMLLAASNQPYLNFLEEKKMLQREIDHYRSKTETLQTELIEALKSARVASASAFQNAVPAPLAPSLPAPTKLKQIDYPGVKHWTRNHKDKSQIAYITVSCVDDSDDDSDNKSSSATDGQDEKGIPAFLETEDSSLIDHDTKKLLYAALREFWNEHVTALPDTKRPPNWSGAGESLRNKFRVFIEDRFPFLRLCSTHWKSDQLWKLNYHSWLTSLRARESKATEKAKKEKAKTVQKKHRKRKRTTDDISDSEDSKRYKSSEFETVLPSDNDDDIIEVSSREPSPKAPTSTKDKIQNGKKLIPLVKATAASTTAASVSPLNGFKINTNALDIAASKASASSKERTKPVSIASSVISLLRQKVATLPRTIPLATKEHELSCYALEGSMYTSIASQNQDEIWEKIDPKLNSLIKQSTIENRRLVVRGSYGLDGLVSFFEHLVESCSVEEALLEGKCSRLIAAIDKALEPQPDSATSKTSTKPLTVSLPSISVTPATAPAPTASATLSRRGRAGTWKIPNFVSPKWECAKDWKSENPTGRLKDFEEYWGSIQSDKKLTELYRHRVSGRSTDTSNVSDETRTSE